MHEPAAGHELSKAASRNTSLVDCLPVMLQFLLVRGDRASNQQAHKQAQLPRGDVRNLLELGLDLLSLFALEIGMLPSTFSSIFSVK